MFGLQDIDVQFLTGSPAWVAIGTILLLALAFLLYRKTNPPLPIYWRVILGLIRVVAVLALMAALSEPVLTYNRVYERPRRLSLMIDHSSSMEREENGLTRAARVDSVLSSPVFRNWGDQAELARYYFGRDLSTDADQVDASATAMGQALEQLAQAELSRPPDYRLLLSDGNSNFGPRPEETSAATTVPVFTVGVASGRSDSDLRLTEVDYNQIVYAGQPTEIDLQVGWSGAAAGQVPVRLMEGDRVLSETVLRIEQADGLADLTLTYTPDRPGQKMLRLSVGQVAGESSPENNSRTIGVKVLKGRLNVLLLTQHPDYELGFLKRFLDQADRYETDLRVIGPGAGNLGGRFPNEQTELNRYDLIVLNDPSPDLLRSQLPLIRSYLSERGGGIWVQFGANSRVGRFDPAVAEIFPFYPVAGAAPVNGSFIGEPVEGQLFHPVVRLGDNRSEIREAWSELPPFRRLVRCDAIAEGAIVLVQSSRLGDSGDQSYPILGYRRVGMGKLMVSAAEPFWTWGFETLAYGGEPGLYDRFVDGSVRWLTLPDDFDPVRIEPQRDVFNRGETVRFDGFAYDAGFRPIPEVTGMVALSREVGTETYEADLLDQGEGRFRAEFKKLPPGEYQFEGSFAKDGQTLRSSHGSIVVESYTLEEYDQSGDPAALARLAQVSGGRYVELSEFDALLDELDLRPVQVTEEHELSLWGQIWLLGLFVGALAVEWVLRKFNQLL